MGSERRQRVFISIFQRKLEVFEELRSLSEERHHQPDVPAAVSALDQSDVYSSLADPETMIYTGRNRRGDWEDPENDLDFEEAVREENPRNQLLDLVNLYSNMHNQRISGESWVVRRCLVCVLL